MSALRRRGYGRQFSSVRGSRRRIAVNRSPVANWEVDRREFQNVRMFLSGVIYFLADLRTDNDDDNRWIHTLKKKNTG